MNDHPGNVKIPRKIVVVKNGSYRVQGNVPLVHKKQVVSEFGEPLTWEKDKNFDLQGKNIYILCRCGHSKDKPFCDGTHREIGFDGSETADTGSTETRSYQIPHGKHIIVKLDAYLCMSSGFCGFRDTGINELIAKSSNTKTRSLVIAMVERCPSGALTYRIEEDGPDIEPDLPEQVAVTTEITSLGPIPGPLWVTGNIPIERSDGEPFEVRNRVTLCRCGESHIKPLCDGTHRPMEEWTLRNNKIKGK